MTRPLLVVGVLALALSACGTTPRSALPSSLGGQAPSSTSGETPPNAGGQAPPAPSESPTGTPSSGTATPSGSPKAAFVPSYEAPADQKLAGAEKLMRDDELVQGWAESANDAFVPPENIPVIAKQCDTVNAFYNPQEKSITMCYEMLEYLRELFAKPEDEKAAKPDPAEVDANAVGAMNGIYFHELGHALIDLYDLPTTGKEEDAVDQLSALVLIGSAEDQKDYSQIISTIEAWGRMSQEEAAGPLDKTVFADEHSLSAQRYYNMMCYLYGSNHNAFLPLVADGELPVQRAVRCEDEYTKMANAWATLLSPHMRTDLPDPSASPSPQPSTSQEPSTSPSPAASPSSPSDPSSWPG